MKVILIKDLKRKGTFGDEIDVTDGYARNYLIPNGFALPANKANQRKFEEIKGKALVQVNELRENLTNTASQIKGKSFTMTALSRDGKLYGSVTPSVIVQQIKNELPDLGINASDIIIEEGNIKFVGSYECKAQFTKDISANFKMVIESDESDEQPELLEAILGEPEANSSEEEYDENSDEDAEESENGDATDIELSTNEDADADVTEEEVATEEEVTN
jgi:large subunit ribosomal protein L9